MQSTKSAFMSALQSELLRRYQWAHDEARLTHFMASVKATLRGESNSWNKDGEASNSAWHAIGQKGKPTYKALRALAD